MPADQPDAQYRGSSFRTRREFLKASAVAGGALIAIYGAAIALGLIERKPATIEPP